MSFTRCEPKKNKCVSSRLRSLFRPASCYFFACKGKFHTAAILISCSSFWSLMLLGLIPDICLFMQRFVALFFHTRTFWREVSSAKHWIWVISFFKYASMQIRRSVTNLRYAPTTLLDEDQCSSESFPSGVDWFLVALCFHHTLKRKLQWIENEGHLWDYVMWHINYQEFIGFRNKYILHRIIALNLWTNQSFLWKSSPSDIFKRLH